VRREPITVVVFNPAADGTMDVSRACKLIRRYASIPFLAYVPLDASYVRGVAHMANEGLEDIIVVRASDSPTRFREIVERVSSVRELAILLDRLQPRLRRLPRSLADVLVDVLRYPHKYRSAEDVAAAAQVTVSGLYRRFREAGLSSPKSFVVGARVFRGFLYLGDDGFSVRDIAAKLGYAHARIFAHQITCVFGKRPSAIRRSLDTSGCIERLFTWFCPEQDGELVAHGGE